MIQRHRLLIKPRFLSGNTTAVSANNSPLVSVNNYQINNEQGLGEGITTPNNVRGFLNDTANGVIINDFFSYLTGSTTTEEFAEIYNSDQKLSNVFNNYYESSILANQPPSTNVVNESLAGTSGITIIQNQYYNYNGLAFTKGLINIPLSIDNGTRNLKVYSALTTYTDEESYYIPVNIKRNHNELERQKFFEEENIIRIINESIPEFEAGDTIGGDFEKSDGDDEIITKDESTSDDFIEPPGLDLGNLNNNNLEESTGSSSTVINQNPTGSTGNSGPTGSTGSSTATGNSNIFNF